MHFPCPSSNPHLLLCFQPPTAGEGEGGFEDGFGNDGGERPRGESFSGFGGTNASGSASDGGVGTAGAAGKDAAAVGGTSSRRESSSSIRSARVVDADADAASSNNGGPSTPSHDREGADDDGAVRVFM
jgi:hypothetical protein